MPEESVRGLRGESDPTLREFVKQALDEADRRYEQRFMQQEKALEQRFAAQERALQLGFAAQEKAMTTAFTAAGTAVDKAELQAQEWRKAANEWRGSMNDREKLFMPRIEAETRYRTLEEKIESHYQALQDKDAELKSTQDKSEGRRTVTTALVAVASSAVVSLVVGIILLSLNTAAHKP